MEVWEGRIMKDPARLVLCLVQGVDRCLDFPSPSAVAEFVRLLSRAVPHRFANGCLTFGLFPKEAYLIHVGSGRGLHCRGKMWDKGQNDLVRTPLCSNCLIIVFLYIRMVH
jgi:hypothetical protein